MPDLGWVKWAGPVGAVAIAFGILVYRMWMRQQESIDKWGTSRDKEREDAQSERKQERDKFMDTLTAIQESQARQLQEFTQTCNGLIALAQQMVVNCQDVKTRAKRVAPSDVNKAAKAGN